MRKKFFATLVAVFMMIGMTGCGDTAARSSSIEPTLENRSTEVQTEESESEGKTEADVATESTEENTGESEETLLESNGMETNLAINDGVNKENSSEQIGSNSGIVVCVQRNAGIGMDYALFLIDPETGGYKELNSFSYRNTNDGYCWPALQIYDSNYHTMFSRDASKMAVTYTVQSTKCKRAGWIDSDGIFFDVPEALGMKPENEFVAQPDYYSIGFTADGEKFVFAEVTGGNHSDNPKIENEGKFYYVKIDDMSVAEGNPLDDEMRRGCDIYRTKGLTGWINDNEFLSNNNQNFVIRDATGTAEDIEPVPGDSRYNRNAISSPSGLIAFVSSPKTTAEDTAIYTTTRDGSDIQRVFECSSFNAQDGKFPGDIIWIYLIRWE